MAAPRFWYPAYSPKCLPVNPISRGQDTSIGFTSVASREFSFRRVKLCLFWSDLNYSRNLDQSQLGLLQLFIACSQKIPCLCWGAFLRDRQLHLVISISLLRWILWVHELLALDSAVRKWHGWQNYHPIAVNKFHSGEGCSVLNTGLIAKLTG